MAKEAACNGLDDLDLSGPISTIRFGDSLDTAEITQTIVSTLLLQIDLPSNRWDQTKNIGPDLDDKKIQIWNGINIDADDAETLT